MSEMSWLQNVASLGVGGVLAAVVLYWKRQDDKGYQRTIERMAAESTRVNLRLIDTLERWTRATERLDASVRAFFLSSRGDVDDFEHSSEAHE